MRLIALEETNIPYGNTPLFSVSEEFRYTIFNSWNGSVLGATNDESIVESIHGNGEDNYVYDSHKNLFIHCRDWED